MLWELWRLSRLELLMRIGYSSAIVVFIGLCATGVIDSNNQATPEFLASLTLVVTLCSAIFSSSWFKIDSIQHGFDVLNFTRPVSTRHMILERLAFIVVTSALCYAIPTMLFGWMSGIQLNYASPLVLISCFDICASCAGWSSSTRLTRVIGIVIVSILFVVAAVLFISERIGDEPLLFALGRPEFVVLEWYQSLILISFAAFCVWVCLRAVEAQRHGDAVWLGWILQERNCGVSRAPDAIPIQFASSLLLQESKLPAWKARLWRHWQQTGKWVLLFAFTLALACALLFTGFQISNRSWTGGPACWLAMLMLCPVVYQIIAAEMLSGLKRKPGYSELSVFDAVQPVRDDASIATLLAVIAALSAIGWGFMAIAAATQTFFSGRFSLCLEMVQRIELKLTAYAWYDVLHAAATIVCFFVITSAAMLTFGMLLSLIKERYIATFTLVGGLLFLLGVLDSIYKWEIDWFWTGVQIGVAVITASACGYGIILCVLRRPFGVKYGFFVVVVSLTALSGLARVGTSMLDHLPMAISTTHIVLVTVNTAAAIIAALCLPPLALNLHRHR
jgi:hypothetical protein